jgi:hypothetical protein
MEVKQIESYKLNGCNINPSHGKKLMLIEYYEDVTNHEFLGAYRSEGLYDKLDKAKAIAKQFPGYEEKLAIPDLVFLCDE